MRNIITVIFFFIFSSSFGQSFSYPLIKSVGVSTNEFVPFGWTILDSAFGDLNKDGTDDAAIVLQHRDRVLLIKGIEDTVFTQPRILLILFKNAANKQFTLIEQSNSFILKHDNEQMDDPYQGISIAKGILILDFNQFYFSGSWYFKNSTYKFRFDSKKFVLIGADISTMDRSTLDFEDYSYNFLTKKRIYTKGNGSYTKGKDQNGYQKSILKSFTLPSLKTFKTFKDPYTWEIDSEVSL